MKKVLKNVARILLGHYRFNRIYRFGAGTARIPLPPGVSCSALTAIPPEPVDDELRKRFSYAGEDARGFGLFVDGHLASTCWFWGPLRLHDPLLWSLEPGEAALVDLMTAVQYRGRGLASLIIQYSGMEMRQLGMRDLYAWIWHNHHASYRAFEKAGWRQIAWVLEIYPFGSRHPQRLSWSVRQRRER